MREDLQQLSGMRWTFTGIFVRHGVHKYLAHAPVAALQFRAVKDSSGVVVAKRAWVNSTLEFSLLDLKEGERVQFDAHLSVRGGLVRLSHASKVLRLAPEQPTEDLPLFKDIGGSHES
jgi:hypothetical protein